MTQPPMRGRDPRQVPSGWPVGSFQTYAEAQAAVDSLTHLTDSEVELLGSVPLDPKLREHGDGGTPVVISEPDSPAAAAIHGIANKLKVRRTSLAGKSLNPQVR